MDSSDDCISVEESLLNSDTTGSDDDDSSSSSSSSGGESMSEDDNNNSESDDDSSDEERARLLIAGGTAVFTDPFNAENTMAVRVYSASFLYPVVKPNAPLNVEYIRGLFDHPLNDTSPQGSDIVDMCHLHYNDTEGIHCIHRDGYIAETGFLYAESQAKMQSLEQTLRDSPFLAAFEVNHRARVCQDVTLKGQTSFALDIDQIVYDEEIRCHDKDQQRSVTFWFVDDGDDEKNRTMVSVYSDGQVAILIDGRDARETDSVMAMIDRVWSLLYQYAPGSADGEGIDEEAEDEERSAVY